MKHLICLWLLAVSTRAYRITGPYGSAQDVEVRLENFQGPIGFDLFAKLPASVKELYIDQSSLDRIEKGALCSHPFEKITIHGSSHPQLTREMLGNCSSLLTFKYSNDNNSTGEATFAPDMFSGLVNLKNLWIHAAQKFPRFTKEFVANSTSLEDLQVAGTNLSSIEAGALDHLANLKILELWNTKMETVDGLFSALKSLEAVVIFKSNVKSFPWHELGSLKHMNAVDLVRNKIEDFDGKEVVKSVPGLMRLRFAGNQVPCDKLKQEIIVVRKSFPSANISVEPCYPVRE